MGIATSGVSEIFVMEFQPFLLLILHMRQSVCCVINSAKQPGFPAKTVKNFMTPGPKVKKLFSCSTQLSMKFELLINIKIA